MIRESWYALDCPEAYADYVLCECAPSFERFHASRLFEACLLSDTISTYALTEGARVDVRFVVQICIAEHPTASSAEQQHDLACSYCV